jgi:tetratricopeptide (TPR) repeat protein
MQHLLDMLQRALTLQNQGEFAQAEKLYNKVLKLNPNHFDALHLLGLSMHQRGDSARGLDLVAAALQIDPNSADALLNYGSMLSALNRHEEALAYYDRALAINPFFVSALKNRANSLAEIGRHQEAVAGFKQALALKPGDAAMLFNCGNSLRQLGRHEEALAFYREVLKLKPDDAALLNSCGNEFALLGCATEALACFDRALQLNPNDAETLYNRGTALLVANREDEGLAYFDRALALMPDHAKYHCDSGLVRLSRGDFARGWKEYEWRFQTVDFITKHKPRNYSQPRWSGEYVSGTLLVYGEQGLGDEILYAGMVPDLAAHADSVVFDSEMRMAKLFARSFPDIRVIGRGQPLPEDIKAHSPLASLGQYLRPSWDAFPQREHGYLVADRELAENLRRRLAPGREFVIGLSWVSKNPGLGTFKTAQLSAFEPFLRLPGCRFIDLQYGDTRAEREAFQQATGILVERLEDVDNTNDIDALAALITACDLVVTVSNTTAHLAGALGKPTIVFVPFGLARFWYWFNERDDSPWYPRVRIKRQQQGQSWQDLVASAVDEAASLVKAAAQVKQPA